MPLPQEFLDRLNTIYPKKITQILDSFNTQRIGSFRVNTLKGNPIQIFKEFEEKNIMVKKFKPINGVYIFKKDQEFAIKGTDSFYQGRIYLQSIASILPALLLNPQPNTKILDMCAAPGSKTTQLAAMTKDKSKIIALEKNKIRCDRLKYNCDLQGASNIEIQKTDAIKYIKNLKNITFDQITLDAPCSAEGRISINREKSYSFWTLKNITKKAAEQYRLFEAALSVLKPGGTLVYSTCTLAPEENEAVVQRILENNFDVHLEDISLWDADYIQSGIPKFKGNNFAETEKMIRILPSQWTEGFFIIKIRKEK